MLGVKMNKIKYFKKEISYIKDESKRRDIEVLINLLPDYFFNIAMGIDENKYPKYGLTNNGMVKYTKVCVRLAIDMFDTVNNFSDNEKDLIIMAILMHDGLINGKIDSGNTKIEHPLLVSELIMKNASKLEMDIDDVRKMCMMIESHMGKWNKSKYCKIELPLPMNELQRFVHRCDYLASRNYLNVRFNKLDII